MLHLGQSIFCGRQPLKNLLTPLLNTLTFICEQYYDLVLTKELRLDKTKNQVISDDTIFLNNKFNPIWILTRQFMHVLVITNNPWNT